MKAYRASFKKKNGESRNMLFAKLRDMPEEFLAEHVTGLGGERQYPDGMELVWDLEADNFRVFNWNTVENSPQEITVDESHFT